MNQYLSTHMPSKISQASWSGIQSHKFTGGRFHQNHPHDQLDSLLVSRKPQIYQNTGKKQYQLKQSTSQQFKTQMRTFDIKYQKKKVQKLIKIPPVTSSELKKHQYPEYKKAKYEAIGGSKIKALFNGQKSTGIYRNFYKSQAKSGKAFETII